MQFFKIIYLIPVNFFFIYFVVVKLRSKNKIFLDICKRVNTKNILIIFKDSKIKK